MYLEVKNAVKVGDSFQLAIIAVLIQELQLSLAHLESLLKINLKNTHSL